MAHLSNDPRILLPAVLLDFAPPEAATANQLLFGGTHNMPGAKCPNCDANLFVFCTIDSQFPLTRFASPNRFVPLLYCLRCPLSWDAFSYRLTTSGIAIIEANPGPPETVDWLEEGLGDFYPAITMTMRTAPKRMLELENYANSQDSWSDDDSFIDEWRSLTRTRFNSSSWIGVNQIGGRGLSIQGVPPPDCDCGRPSKFLASFVGDGSPKIRIAPSEYIQVMFWYCPHCSVVFVWHSIT